MKKNEIIELNGEEYTLELNRDSFLQIDKLCNVQKSMNILERNIYQYMDDVELSDDYNPMEEQNNEDLTDESIESEIKLKEQTLQKMVERAMFLWLYPNHKLPISKVREILKPYLEDEKKSEWLGQKVGEYLRECVELRENYLNEQKNLKALANKKN